LPPGKNRHSTVSAVPDSGPDRGPVLSFIFGSETIPEPRQDLTGKPIKFGTHSEELADIMSSSELPSRRALSFALQSRKDTATKAKTRPNSEETAAVLEKASSGLLGLFSRRTQPQHATRTASPEPELDGSEGTAAAAHQPAQPFTRSGTPDWVAALGSDTSTEPLSSPSKQDPSPAPAAVRQATTAEASTEPPTLSEQDPAPAPAYGRRAIFAQMGTEASTEPPTLSEQDPAPAPAPAYGRRAILAQMGVGGSAVGAAQASSTDATADAVTAPTTPSAATADESSEALAVAEEGVASGVPAEAGQLKDIVVQLFRVIASPITLPMWVLYQTGSITLTVLSRLYLTIHSILFEADPGKFERILMRNVHFMDGSMRQMNASLTAAISTIDRQMGDINRLESMWQKEHEAYLVAVEEKKLTETEYQETARRFREDLAAAKKAAVSSLVGGCCVQDSVRARWLQMRGRISSYPRI